MSAAQLQPDKTSVRAKSKPDPLARKTTFRTVLDNPLQLNWPAPSAAVRRALLEALLELLSAPAREGEPSIAEWRIHDHARRRGRTAGAGKGKGKEPHEGDATIRTAPPPPAKEPLARPAILDGMSIGINDCTRALECRIRWGRWELGDRSAAPPPAAGAKAPADAMRRSHKRKHSSAAKASLAARLDASTCGSAELAAPQSASHPPALEFLSEPPPAPATALPPFLRAAENGSVRILPNYDQLRSITTDSKEGSTFSLIDLIFVCRPDLNPTSLVAHLPSMAAAANGVRQALEERAQALKSGKEEGDGMEVDLREEGKPPRPETRAVYLIPLDVGAEQSLANALALRRVACIGLSSLAPQTQKLLALVQEHLIPLSAPWLVPHLLEPPPVEEVARLIPTHIKHLRTSAPVDLKAALAAKKLVKVEAKRRRREKPAGERVYVAED